MVWKKNFNGYRKIHINVPILFLLCLLAGECEYPGVGREDHPTDDSLIRLLNLEPVATTLHKQPPSPPSSQPLSMLQRLSATTSGAMEGEQVLQRQTEAKDTIDRVEKQQHEDACTKSREEGDSSIDNR